MASLSNTRRPEVARAARQNATAQRRAVARKGGGSGTTAAPATATATTAAAATSAYLQAKLAVSRPGDASEQQADQVATQVARSPRTAAPVGATAVSPAGTGTVARATQPTPATAGATPIVQRASLTPGATSQAVDEVSPVPAAREIQRTPAPAASTPADVQLDARTDADAGPAAETGPSAEPAVAPGTEQRIQDQLGRGEPLAQEARADMQARFGQDFSQVQIHTNAEADALCTATQARAFTVGNDVFFAAGEYAPERDAGRELLAHELTHVVQQGGGAVARVQRCAAPAAAGAAAAGTSCVSVTSGTYANTSICLAGGRSMSLPRINLPHLKSRNSNKFPKPLAVRQGGRPRTNQTTLWRGAVHATAVTQLDALTTAARTAGAVETSGGAETFFLTLQDNPSFLLFGTTETLLPRIEIPIWDQDCRPTNFQVDHVREMQLNGDDRDCNYELLEGEANMGAGRAIAQEISTKISGGLAALAAEHPTAGVPSPASWRNVKDTYNVSFADFDWSLVHDGSANQDRAWSLGELTEGRQVAKLRPLNTAERTALGQVSTPAIYASAQGGVPLRPVGEPQQEWLSRVELVAWSPADVAASPTAALGTLNVRVFKAGTTAHGGISAASESTVHNWTVNRIPGLNAGHVDRDSVRLSVINSLRLPGMSPIQMDDVELTSGGIVGDGRVLPTVPLIGDADIRIRLNGAEAQIYKTFSMEELRLPAPFHMDSCELTVFYGSSSGLGLDGRAEFGVDRLGRGFLGAAASLEGGFALEGGFDFDTTLFDRASVTMAYRDNQLSLAGDIGIDSPDRIRGIRSANLHMAYEDGAFSATGDVQPDIPGVEQAALRVSYAEATGLTIGGALQLAANPAIRSGSIDVTVNKLGENWRVAATGTAQPAIPGVDSELTVSYDDGAFDARFSGAFQRGMLAGTAEVGVTNRAVDEAGHANGAAVPGASLIVYGAGSATLQIAPWLQGTAGIRFAADGEVTVSSEIGLPGSLEIFGRHELHRPLFAMATQIPVFPGIVAEVGGNLNATAGIGPGTLDQLAIHIDYNPSHEDATHVTGDAHLNVPADAGVRLGARAGIGLGITGASATGGIELGGSLGVAGAAEAGVHIDWTPASGLVVDAEGYLHAEPRFRFDVSGYVSVSALGFSIYDERWELAAYELGSNLRLGVRFPIHYEDGQPFEVSLDDVQFEVPDIDPAATVRQLGEQIF